MRSANRVLFPAAVLLSGIVASAMAASLGPSHYIVCGSGHLLDRLAQKIMQPLGAGQIDGPTGTYCTVPATQAWLLAGAVLLCSVALAIVVVRRRRSPAG